jgi:SAM-dependent methyltransferase
MNNDDCAVFCCPCCRSALVANAITLQCNTCRRTWPVQAGVVLFSQKETGMSPYMAELLDTTERFGWQQGLFNYRAFGLSSPDAGMVDEDERSADWVYMLRSKPGQKALVIGPGLGTIPFRMAGLGLHVYTIDCASGPSRFINAVCRERKIKNICPAVIDTAMELPFLKNTFDAVIFRNYSEYNTLSGFQGLLKKSLELLKPGGQAAFYVNNTMSPLGMFRESDGSKARSKTFSGYRKALKTAGFFTLEILAPLPSVRGIPLFMLPLSKKQTLTFFLKMLFPLFATVSPEVKKRYGVIYDLGKIAAYSLQKLHGAWMVPWFCPGYLILARAQPEKSHA